tara:strand:+ start:268 stop:420 length:153 start_codon:yes stop_codon:yes gene_type:complete
MKTTGPTKNKSCQKIMGILKVREYIFKLFCFEFILNKGDKNIALFFFIID